jgi:hypothetical protein
MSIEEKAIAYVLGSLSEQEREGVARERLFHRALDREIEQVERVYSALADAPARRRPAERLWGQLVAAIGHEEKALADKLVEPCTAGDWQDFGPNIEFKTLWSPKAILIRPARSRASTTSPRRMTSISSSSPATWRWAAAASAPETISACRPARSTPAWIPRAAACCSPNIAPSPTADEKRTLA